MRCSDFLSQYSDFRDGVITDLSVLRELRQHLQACPRCQAYERVMARGIGALRNLQEIEPSAGFRRELRARLAGAALRASRPAALTPAGVAAALLVAAAGAMLLYEGLAARRTQLADAPQSLPIVIVNPGVPFVSFTPAEGAAARGVVVPASTQHPGGDWGTIAP